MAKTFFYFLLVIILIGCSNKKSDSISPIAKEYVDEVITLLQNNSVNKNKIDWAIFKKDVYKHARNSKSIIETYPSISYAVTKLNDSHSYFAPNIETDDIIEEKPLPILEDEIVPDNIGYIRIPFCIGSEDQSKNYINSIIEKISNQDNINLKGWIVDLRGNFGGNMWPMLVSVGPILGDGIVGYFIDADNKTSTWKYENGKAYLNSTIIEESPLVYSLKLPNPYVAILTNKETASSGEAITVCFKGRNKTKSFGTKTFGVSSGNKSHTLSDGSRINLTESIFADRNMNKYGNSIFTDNHCEEINTVDEAVDWLNKKTTTNTI